MANKKMVESDNGEDMHLTPSLAKKFDLSVRNGNVFVFSKKDGAVRVNDLCSLLKFLEKEKGMGNTLVYMKGVTFRVCEVVVDAQKYEILSLN